MHDPDRSANVAFPPYAAFLAFLRTPQREAVGEMDRCVNEGADGCATRAEANGWCGPCWRTIVPAS